MLGYVGYFSSRCALWNWACCQLSKYCLSSASIKISYCALFYFRGTRYQNKRLLNRFGKRRQYWLWKLHSGRYTVTVIHARVSHPIGLCWNSCTVSGSMRMKIVSTIRPVAAWHLVSFLYNHNSWWSAFINRETWSDLLSRPELLLQPRKISSETLLLGDSLPCRKYLR